MSRSVNYLDVDIAKDMLRQNIESTLGLLSLTSVQSMDVLQGVVDEMRPKATEYEYFNDYWQKECP